MRKTKIEIGEYYHVFNRGNNKQIIFRDYRDWARFLFLIVYLQSNVHLYNLGRQVTHYVKHSVFNIQNQILAKIIKNRKFRKNLQKKFIVEKLDFAKNFRKKVKKSGKNSIKLSSKNQKNKKI